jgi:transcription elongation GreA/GreB family factor
MIVNKIAIKSMCLEQLQQKIAGLKLAVLELSEGVGGKSSAGDKHETERAMAQLQQEQLNHQINQLIEMQQVVQSLSENVHKVIQKGSLVQTDKGWFYIATAIGKLYTDNQLIMVISSQSPLSVQFSGKMAGDKVTVNQLLYEIYQVI